MVNEFSAGVRRQDEGFGADDPDEFQRRLVGRTLATRRGSSIPS